MMASGHSSGTMMKQSWLNFWRLGPEWRWPLSFYNDRVIGWVLVLWVEDHAAKSGTLYRLSVFIQFAHTFGGLEAWVQYTI